MTKRVRVYTAEQRLANRVREKARYEANREKIQARKKVYREANPEKAIKTNHYHYLHHLFYKIL